MNEYWFYKVGLVVVFLCFALSGGAKVKLPGRICLFISMNTKNRK